MYVYIYIYIWICSCSCMCVYVHVYIYIYICIYIYVCIHVYVSMYMCICGKSVRRPGPVSDSRHRYDTVRSDKQGWCWHERGCESLFGSRSGLLTLRLTCAGGGRWLLMSLVQWQVGRASPPGPPRPFR